MITTVHKDVTEDNVDDDNDGILDDVDLCNKGKLIGNHLMEDHDADGCHDYGSWKGLNHGRMRAEEI